MTYPSSLSSSICPSSFLDSLLYLPLLAHSPPILSFFFLPSQYNFDGQTKGERKDRCVVVSPSFTFIDVHYLYAIVDCIVTFLCMDVLLIIAVLFISVLKICRLCSCQAAFCTESADGLC